jgi:hypothetical protein
MGMKAYKVELLIIDFDGMGAGDIEATLENTKYPNHCFDGLSVKSVVEKDIGEWNDEHPLNQTDKCEDEYLRIFGIADLQSENEHLINTVESTRQDYADLLNGNLDTELKAENEKLREAIKKALPSISRAMGNYEEARYIDISVLYDARRLNNETRNTRMARSPKGQDYRDRICQSPV